MFSSLLKSPPKTAKPAAPPVAKPAAAPAAATSLAVQTWAGLDIPTEVHSRVLAGAYRAWMAAVLKRLPRFNDMVESNARVALDDMMLLTKTDNDYLVVAQSANYIRNVGRDLRGLSLSEFKVPIANAMKEIYDTCVTKREPVYARYVSELSQQSIYWEVLVVPLAADDSGKPAFVLNMVSLIDDKSAVMQMVFDRSPVGMIVSVPTQGEGGKTEDGIILSINDRAKSMLRLADRQRQIQTLRQLGPWFRDGTAWTQIASTTDNGRPKIYYRDDAAKNFAVTIEAISRFVLFSIVEVDEYEVRKLKKPPQ
jgi:hypothetical protein